MWAAQYLRFDEPNRWMTSGGLGTMGYGVPAAMGVQVAHPASKVVCVTSEGSLMMNVQEMVTISKNNLPVKILNLKNNVLGMIRQVFFHGRHAGTLIEIEVLACEGDAQGMESPE